VYSSSDIVHTAFNSFEKRNYKRSIEILNKAEDIAANNEIRADLLNLKGFSFLGLNDLETGAIIFEESLRKYPNYSPAYIGMAEISYLRGEFEKAESYLHQVNLLNTQSELISKDLKELETLLRIKVTDKLYIARKLELIQKYLEANQLNEAEAEAEDGLMFFSSDVDLLNNYSVILILKNKYTKAIEIINKILNIDSTNEIACENLKYVKGLNLFDKSVQHEPIEIYLELNTYCNYRCIFCQNDEMSNKRMITLNEIKGLDSMMKLAKKVDITGFGEITLHKDFEHILKYFAEKNAPVRFVSNGYNLTEKVVDIIAESSVTEIVISVNSLDKIIYKKLMGIDGLERVLKNIDNLTKSFKGRLEFSFVINQYNFHEVKSFIDFGSKYNKHVSLLGLTPTTQYPEFLELEYSSEVISKLEEYRAYAKEKKISFWMFNIENQKYSAVRNNNLIEIIKSCDWVYKKFFLNSKGDATPCCWSSRILGNIYNESFEQIWFGEKYNELRSLISQGDTKYCFNCRRAG